VVTDKKQLLIGIIIQINCRGEWQPVTKQLLAKAKNGGIGKNRDRESQRQIKWMGTNLLFNHWESEC
jgi:hypothetical protein